MAAVPMRLLLSCLLLVLALPSLAAPARDVRAQGQGSGRDEAVAAALVAGLRQSPLLADRDPAALQALMLDWVRGEGRLPVDRAGHKPPQAVVADGPAGLVRDYEVLAVDRQGAGQWTATVRVELVEAAATAGPRQARALVLPFSLQAEDTAETGAMAVQAAVNAEAAEMAVLRSQLEAALGREQAGLATVPLPQPEDPRLGLAFTSPGSVPWAAVAARAGNDFFVAVDVQDYLLEFHPGNLRKQEPAFWKARFLLSWEVLSAPGAVVQASGLLRLDRSDAELNAVTRIEAAGRDRTAAVQRIGAVVAARLSRVLAERLLPAQVRAVQGDSIELDAGALRLRPGETLAVLGAGVEEQEEGAARPVLRDGARIAVLETVEAGDGRARARLLRGSAATVLPGAPVRRLTDLPVPRLP